MPRKSNPLLSAIEIHLEREPGVYLLRGNRDESPSVAVRGHVLISTPDTMTLRRVSLRLVGVLKIKWQEELPNRGSSATTYPIRYEKTVFEREFDDLDLSALPLSGARTPLSGRTTPIGSMSNLASYFAVGHGTGGSGTSTPTGSNHIKPGSHLVPFELVVPGRVPETIEGNPNVQLAYVLMATAERGRFQSNLIARKHLRFVRTLGIDTFDAAHTVSVNNTWPGKVDYNIVLESKSIAIGGRLELSFEFAPAIKRLRLGNIHIQIVEMLQLSPPTHHSYSDERVVHSKIFDMSDPQFQGPDRWNFTLSMKMPASLASCSQDVALPPHFKITHKVKVFVSLKNPDGHTSELRASLPMALYISPSIRISTGHIPSPSLNGRGTDQTSSSQSEVLFDAIQQVAGDGAMAPPNYSEHVYDQIWSDMPTPLSLSPSQSGLHTPFSSVMPLRTRPGFDPLQSEQLRAGLQALALSRDESSPPAVDIVALSRVPSYESAVNTHQALGEVAPRYENQ